jgi:hypothetical protein
MKQLKQLDIEQTEFQANGKTYYIESEISFDRYHNYMMLQNEMAYGISFVDMMKAWSSVIEAANKQRFSDIVITAHNITEGVKTLGKKQIPALMICALFVNEKDEDRTKITEDQIRSKINDWAAEGYSIVPFFSLAIRSVSGLASVWNALQAEVKEAAIEPV